MQVYLQDKSLDLKLLVQRARVLVSWIDMAKSPWDCFALSLLVYERAEPALNVSRLSLQAVPVS